jgi:hypothetical protein
VWLCQSTMHVGTAAVRTGSHSILSSARVDVSYSLNVCREHEDRVWKFTDHFIARFEVFTTVYSTLMMSWNLALLCSAKAVNFTKVRVAVNFNVSVAFLRGSRTTENECVPFLRKVGKHPATQLFIPSSLRMSRTDTLGSRFSLLSFVTSFIPLPLILPCRPGA